VRTQRRLVAGRGIGEAAPRQREVDALRRPYDEAPERAAYAEPAPAAVTASYRTFCGT
jgi:hypothetical protein